MSFLRLSLVFNAAAFWLAAPLLAESEPPNLSATAVWIRVTDNDSSWNGNPVYPAAAWEEMQPVPIRPPSVAFAPQTPLPDSATALRRRFFAAGIPQSLVQQLSQQESRGVYLGAELALGAEARTRAATDTGSLLGKSPSMLGIETQKRNPIVTDPRQRGSRVGSLAASGSYWVPARIDLDTMLSKIDSRIVSSALAINGPYAVQHGPGASFLIVELIDAPRFDTFQRQGSTSVEYKFNGQQLYGRQTVWGGDQEWGFRLGYGHRTGNDYLAGDNRSIPSSYNSRDFDVALGWDVSDTSSLEFSFLRLDQTNLELPGQAFDIDFLVTDGFSVEYVQTEQAYYDRLEFDVWYNRTRFLGSAQRLGKRRQFPFLDLLGFVGATDVDSMSLGHRLALSWGRIDTGLLTVGTDLRLIRQELNEITSGRLGGAIWSDANSPIPRSDSFDPGVFLETTKSFNALTIEAGVRADFRNANIIDNPSALGPVGSAGASYADIVGSDQYDQNFILWGAYLAAEYELGDCWTVFASGGYAERPPNLTELYAAEPFMFLLQNGLNTITGNPGLAEEKHTQVDAGIRCDYGFFRGRMNGYFASVGNYVTFENMGEVLGPPFGQVEQTNLRYVNTDLATFVGAELSLEADATAWCSPFAIFRFVEGRDQDRNGAFASLASSGPGVPLRQMEGLPRGFFSLAPRSPKEPLPGIAPLEARIGLRAHQSAPQPRWGVEISSRIVNAQDRVAVSLNESSTPGFTTWDLRSYWNVTEEFLLTAGIENFTDQTYREHFDFRSASGIQMLQPGINFYVGARRVY